ncbi:hypothetical protein GCM10009602_70450 [Nocardiopsis tropica]
MSAQKPVRVRRRNRANDDSGTRANAMRTVEVGPPVPLTAPYQGEALSRRSATECHRNTYVVWWPAVEPDPLGSGSVAGYRFYG